MNLNLTDRVICSNDTFTVAVEEELVLLDVSKATYYGLNKMGTNIWHLLESPTSIQNLCETLTQSFDLPFERCAAEVLQFLAQLQAKGLVHVVS